MPSVPSHPPPAPRASFSPRTPASPRRPFPRDHSPRPSSPQIVRYQQLAFFAQKRYSQHTAYVPQILWPVLAALTGFVAPGFAARVASAAAPVAVVTTPTVATVFPGGALIARKGVVTLAQGLHRLALGGFPARMDDASVRIRTSAGTHLVGFAVEEVPVAEVVSPEARALEKEQERLQDADRELSDRRSVLGDRRAFVLALRATFQLRSTVNMALGPIDVVALGTVHAFSAGRFAAIGKEEREVDDRREKLARELDLVRRKLAMVSSKREKQTKAVAVDVRAAEDGEVTLEVKYVVPGARWHSVYDAYLEPTGVRLVHHAVVSQETGEDWEDVKLTLSSADTTSHIAVPQVAAAYLTLTPPYRPRNYPRRPMKRYRGSPKGGATSGDMPSPAPRMAREEAKAEAPEAVSTARAAEFAATYDIDGRVSISSDGASRKITVATAPLEAEVHHEATPRLLAGALLVAEGKHRGEVPLLPGAVSLHLGKDYVGESALAFVGPGGKLRLPFGRDDRLRVKRTRLSRLVSNEGVFTKEYKIAYLYKFEVENLVGRPVKLSLLDLIPASTDERIKVEVQDATTPRSAARAEDAKGTVRWELALVAGEKKELTLSYTVVYPRNLNVQGLE